MSNLRFDIDDWDFMDANNAIYIYHCYRLHWVEHRDHKRTISGYQCTLCKKWMPEEIQVLASIKTGMDLTNSGVHV